MKFENPFNLFKKKEKKEEKEGNLSKKSNKKTPFMVGAGIALGIAGGDMVKPAQAEEIYKPEYKPETIERLKSQRTLIDKEIGVEQKDGKTIVTIKPREDVKRPGYVKKPSEKPGPTVVGGPTVIGEKGKIPGVEEISGPTAVSGPEAVSEEDWGKKIKLNKN